LSCELVYLGLKDSPNATGVSGSN